MPDNFTEQRWWKIHVGFVRELLPDDTIRYKVTVSGVNGNKDFEACFSNKRDAEMAACKALIESATLKLNDLEKME